MPRPAGLPRLGRSVPEILHKRTDRTAGLRQRDNGLPWLCRVPTQATAPVVISARRGCNSAGPRGWGARSAVEPCPTRSGWRPRRRRRHGSVGPVRWGATLGPDALAARGLPVRLARARPGGAAGRRRQPHQLVTAASRSPTRCTAACDDAASQEPLPHASSARPRRARPGPGRYASFRDVSAMAYGQPCPLHRDELGSQGEGEGGRRSCRDPRVAIGVGERRSNVQVQHRPTRRTSSFTERVPSPL
jgi:hypothetical protein